MAVQYYSIEVLDLSMGKTATCAASYSTAFLFHGSLSIRCSYLYSAVFFYLSPLLLEPHGVLLLASMSE